MFLESSADLISDTAYVLFHPSMENLKAYVLSHPVASYFIPVTGTVLAGGCASRTDFALSDIILPASRNDADLALFNPEPHWDTKFVSLDGKRTYHLRLEGKDCLVIYATPGSEFGLEGKFGLEYWDEKSYIFQDENNRQDDVIVPLEDGESSYLEKGKFIKIFNRDLEERRKHTRLAGN